MTIHTCIRGMASQDYFDWDKSTKQQILRKICPKGTCSLIMKYEGNDDDSYLYTWHGGSHI